MSQNGVSCKMSEVFVGRLVWVRWAVQLLRVFIAASNVDEGRLNYFYLSQQIFFIALNISYFT